MRTAASALLVILALLLATVAGPALWMQQNIVDSAGFTKLAGPLGSDASFQEGLSTLVATQGAASLDVPPQLQALASTIIKGAVRSIYTEPGYEQAWTETLKHSHDLTFSAAGNADIKGDLKVDIAPLAALVATKIGNDLGVSLPTPADVVVSVEQPKVAQVLPLATTLGGWGIWLAGIAVVLAALGVVAARRRSLTAILTGAGLAVVALVWLLGSSYLEKFLGCLVEGNQAAQQIGVTLGTLARQSWQGGITATFVIAGVVAVAGVGALVVGRRRTT
ncbi:hypothetical protein AAGW05_11270 [Arthrobacter sp. LAPM80]|uniref:hypothetical protein n=1 Tax=Arthrobacter sp. LAPM80 TaxID=3141788 RepID=UPI00398A6641